MIFSYIFLKIKKAISKNTDWIIPVEYLNAQGFLCHQNSFE